MPLEPKRCRHGAVAIDEVAVGVVVSAGPGQQRPNRSSVTSYSMNPGSTGTAASRSIAVCASALSASVPRSSSVSTKSGNGGSKMNDVAGCEFVVYDGPKDLV